MPRYAKKGTTRADIGQKLFTIVEENKMTNTLQWFKEEVGIELNSFADIPSEKEEQFFEMALHELDHSPLKVYEDLMKINFDFENCGIEILGDVKNELPDGTAILWCWAGGDWEFPVRFVLYIDPKGEIRGYVPEDGNIYCHKCKSAYGTCECDEEANERVFGEEEPDPEWDKMYEDVCNRIQTRE